GHFADLAAMPEDELGAVYATAKRVSGALREVRGCDGTSTRQHNGSGAGQDVFHFPVHLFPRFAGGGLHSRGARVRRATAEGGAPGAVGGGAAGGAGVKIAPCGGAPVERAAALLEERHRRQREAEPLLPAEVDFRVEVAALWEEDGASGAFAEDGYLLGTKMD